LQATVDNIYTKLVCYDQHVYQILRLVHSKDTTDDAKFTNNGV